MSIIYGVINLNGAPADARLLASMRGGMNACVRDDERSCAVENAAFGCLATHGTPESVHERTPVYLAAERLLFVAAGRLDNRVEVAAALGVAADHRTADGELLMRSYLAWGDGAPTRLLGDWSFAAFHLDRQQLVLARDHHGCTALDYHIGKEHIAFCSSTAGLLALAGAGAAPDADTVVRSLLFWKEGGSGEQTFYRDIRHVPPAHVVTAGSSGVTARRYWFPEQVNARTGMNAQAYAAELTALLDSAVAARMRETRPVAATLSGGRDSATVAYLAAEQLAATGRKLTTLSHVPLHEPGRRLRNVRIGDERPGIEAVVAASGRMEPRFLDSAAISVVAGLREYLDLCHAPIHAAINAYWLLDIAQTAARDGYGAVLAGDMGNATFSFTGLPYQLPWRTLLAMQGFRTAVRQKVLRPLRAARRSRSSADTLKPGPQWQHYYVNFAFLADGGFLRAMQEQAFRPGTPPTFRDSRDAALGIMLIGRNPRGYYAARVAQRYGVEWRDPAADVRVMEYALSIPNEMFFDARGRGGNIVKTMMRGRLPDSVLFPRRKGLQSADAGLRLLACRAEMDALLDQVQRSGQARSCLDVAALVRDWNAVRSVTDNSFDHALLGRLLRAAMIGLFLTRFD